MGKQSWLLCSQCIIYSNNWRWDTLSPDGPAWPGFPWGPGAPCTKPDRKQCQSVSSWSIFTASKSWCRLPHCYCEVCLENCNGHSTLTCVPIERMCVCVCVCWVVSEVFGDCVGGRSEWKMGLSGAVSPYGCGFPALCCLTLCSHPHAHANTHLPNFLMSNADLLVS